MYAQAAKAAAQDDRSSSSIFFNVSIKCVSSPLGRTSGPLGVTRRYEGKGS